MEHFPIIETINASTIYADLQRWQQCRLLFADEVFVDYSSLSGKPAQKMRADDFIEEWKSFLSKFSFTQHFVTNHIVSTHLDEASVYSHFFILHHKANSPGGDFWKIYGSFQHKLLDTFSGWKITSISFVIKHTEGNPLLAEFKK